ncbi:extracellular solute-binding protein [Kribbella sp. NPDC049174]|uniref:extracellular solute-binding protein n=1 Tax=Kribbella sp. NPDC049174 TaxID=3364112 RepID=UPI0037197E05
MTDSRTGLARRTLLKAGLAVAAVGATGCDGSGSAGEAGDLAEVSKGAMTDFTAGQQFTATEDLTFSTFFPEWPEVPYRKDWMVWKEITKRTRVKLEARVVPLSDYISKRSLQISAGDAPLLIPLTYVGEESSLTSSGAILPVSDYVHLMPNFRARVEEYGLQADLDRMRQEDGRYYLLPGMFQDRNPDFSLTIRADRFEQAGIAVPQTWDEVRTALRGLKDKNPGMYPFSDNYQGNSTLNFAAVSFGTRAGWGFGNGMVFDPATDSFVYGPATSQHKDLVTFFHSLIADGLMDPESYTRPPSWPSGSSSPASHW